ncbi:LysM peptidoglycan-binding domain-containing protein [Microbacterium sp. HA-8]|uniref:LysM peptidoglycan-binding domain-containing protein n=1 Tax=unclassified Microbacterium TaxID=2609290 RepID=UPI0025FA3260|nr:LysM peptidoglycan-binding domain-containing protein [Microbacterium sp.]
MRLLPHALRSARAQVAVPAALVGTLAATLVAAPADAAEPSDRSLRSAWRSVPLSVPPTDYTVSPGDTVSTIASRFGLRTADVLAWNGLTWSSLIRPGDVITLTPQSPAPAAAPEPAPAPVPVALSHTVAGGDTLSTIAARFGVSLQALFDANGMGWGTVIYPGQVVSIPGAVAAASVAPAPAPAPAPVAAPAPAAATHTIVSGDTLSGIAAAHGVSLQALFDANGLGGGSIIYPGQQVSIPGAAEPAAAPTPAPAPATAAVSSALDAEQAAGAALIISIGRELGVSDRGIAIALATAMVESWIRNLDWGDRDSLGLYQQRPSMGWGTPEQVRDADRSIRVFYGGPADPNGSTTRGLLDVSGWESMGFSDAAQAVQRSAFPERYGQWEAAAYEWIATYG